MTPNFRGRYGTMNSQMTLLVCLTAFLVLLLHRRRRNRNSYYESSSSCSDESEFNASDESEFSTSSEEDEDEEEPSEPLVKKMKLADSSVAEVDAQRKSASGSGTSKTEEEVSPWIRCQGFKTKQTGNCRALFQILVQATLPNLILKGL